MRVIKLSLIAILICLVFNVCSQTKPSELSQHFCYSFDEAKIKGISIKELDSIYQSAFNAADTSRSVFKEEEVLNKFQEEYVKMLRSFGTFLSENDFKWETSTKGFNRIYFNADGSIDYFLFRINEENFPEERLNEFQRILNLFIQEYKLDITAPKKFVQCGGINYKP